MSLLDPLYIPLIARAHLPTNHSPPIRLAGIQPAVTMLQTHMYNAAGLTPGAPRWDETPSPLFAPSTESNSPAVLKGDRPVAPGAEISVANVRRHIKHRLEAAKVTCDHTLRKTIDAITRFADEQKAREQAEMASAHTSAGVDDQPRDYFDAMSSESPVLDAEHSDVELGGETDTGRLGSRQSFCLRASLSPDFPLA